MSTYQEDQPKQGPLESILIHLNQSSQYENVTDIKKEEHPLRAIRLTHTNNSVTVGRASKTASKGLVPSSDNLYFASPVMSREHAIIMADFEKETISIKDVGSLHGTAVNGDAINTTTMLHEGDIIRFGVHVARGTEVFHPMVCVMKRPIFKRTFMRSGSYKVPDFIELSDSDSNHLSDTDMSDLHDRVLDVIDVQADYDEKDGTDKYEVHEAPVSVSYGYASSEDMDDEDSAYDDTVVYDTHKPLAEVIQNMEAYHQSFVASSLSGDDQDSNDGTTDLDKNNGDALMDEEIDRCNTHLPAKAFPSQSPSETDDENGPSVEHIESSAPLFTSSVAGSGGSQKCAVQEEPPMDELAKEYRAMSSSPVARETTDDFIKCNISSILNPPLSPLPPQELDSAMSKVPNVENALDIQDVSYPSDHESSDSFVDGTFAWQNCNEDGVSSVAISKALGAMEDMTSDSEPMMSSAIVSLPTVQQASSAKKRKAEDMLSTEPTRRMERPNIDELVAIWNQEPSTVLSLAHVSTLAPAAKRPATASTMAAVATKHKGRKGLAWAVAEKIGIAALGGAVVLGSLIYTAPTF